MSKKDVYTIVESPARERKFFLRIGEAVENNDGSINVKLDAIPTNGMLHIRNVPEEVASSEKK